MVNTATSISIKPIQRNLETTTQYQGQLKIGYHLARDAALACNCWCSSARGVDAEDDVFVDDTAETDLSLVRPRW